MRIYYNQEKYLEVSDNLTISEFLEFLDIKADGVAVSVDEKVVRKSEFNTFVIRANSQVDVFNMVSGG